MCKVISVANIKGGVAKTTTAANLGVGLARRGKRVLLIDLDPQGSLSLGLGIRNNKDLTYTVSTAFQKVINEIEIGDDEGIIHNEEGVDILPRGAIMQNDKQIDIIADYYMALGDYTSNEKYSESNVRVYTSPESDCWLVLERKGENAIQARMTDEKGVIISWDNYEVMNAAVSQIEAVCLSVSGRSEILFTPAELKLIERYADYDRKTTMGKLDILEGCFRNDLEEKDAKSIIDKLWRISDKTFNDLYSVSQRKMMSELENSVHNRMEQAKVRADKYNVEHRSQTVDHKKVRGIVL